VSELVATPFAYFYRIDILHLHVTRGRGYGYADAPVLQQQQPVWAIVPCRWVNDVGEGPSLCRWYCPSLTEPARFTFIHCIAKFIARLCLSA
jgi:hypothetical protein